MAALFHKHVEQQPLLVRRLPSTSSNVPFSIGNGSSSTYTSLPNQPVPSLNSTLTKYLKSVQPFLNSQESEQTWQIVKRFGAADGIGSKLQALVEERARNKATWLSDWWLYANYMGKRYSVVVDSNPGCVWPFKVFNGKRDQLEHAARIILGALDFKDLVDMQKLPQDKAGKTPMDMVQYDRLFGTCRIPGIEQDSLTYNNFDHISVFHNNHIFILSVIGEDGVRLNEEQFLQQLEDVVENSMQPLDNCIGVLTTEQRDNWGKTYNKLINDESNKLNLQKIEQSLFCLCLDRGCNIENLDYSRKQSVAAEQVIHGGGSNSNSGNRWFDKTIQFVVGEDGINGTINEHGPVEGQPVANMGDHIINFINDAKYLERPPSKSTKKNIRLDFNVSEEVEHDIKLAKINIDKMASNLEVECFTFKLFGKEFVKSQKLSPDSFIQMAIQLAFYRIHRVPGSHYEAASTKQYTEGRTETIRSCSEESVKFSKMMLDGKISSKHKIETLRNAVDSHKVYAVEAGNGFGVDRHLLALKLIALENDIPIPDFYSDVAFVRSSRWTIKSSQVYCKNEGFMCYGPMMVNEGYSTCYNPRSDDIIFSTTAFKDCAETDTKIYRKAIEDSLVDMYNLLVRG